MKGSKTSFVCMFFFIEPSYSETRSALTSASHTGFSTWGTTPVSEPAPQSPISATYSQGLQL